MTLKEDELIRTTRESFLRRGRARTIPLKRRSPASVIVPVMVKDGELHVLFTRRTELVRDHKGQISFPGGVREKGDRNLLHTALRETDEEIRLSPGDIEIIGRLDDIATPTGYRITPFAGFIPDNYSFVINSQEIEEILIYPESRLIDPDIFSEEIRTYGRRKYRVCFFSVEQDTVIWGATARILMQLLQITCNRAGGGSCLNDNKPIK